MSIITKEIAWGDFNTEGVPGSGVKDLDKSQQRQYLGLLEKAVSDGAVVVSTKTELDAITPAAGKYPLGIVLSDATASNNGYYAWANSSWTWCRGFPDSLAVLENVSGTANAITADTAVGVNPSDVVMLVLVPSETSTSETVTIRLNGGSEQAITAADGGVLAVGDLVAGETALLVPHENELRLLFSTNTTYRAEAAAIVAEAAQVAAEAAAVSAGGNGDGVYPNRAAAEAADILAAVYTASYLDDGRILEFVRDAAGTALTTADGSTWSPVGDVRPAHWGIERGVDETTKLLTMISWAAANSRKILWPSGVYELSEIEILQDVVNVDWEAVGGPVIIRSNKIEPNGPGYFDDHFVKIGTPIIRTDALTQSISPGSSTLHMGSTADIDDSTLLICRTSHVIETDHRGQARHGFVVPAKIMSGTQAQIERDIPCTAIVGNVSGSIAAVNSSTDITVTGLESLSRSEGRYEINFTTVGGVAADEDAKVTDFDPTTQRLECHSDNNSFPTGLQVGDTFTLVRKVEVDIVKATRVRIKGDFEFQRGTTTDATAGDLGFRGLVIEHAHSLELEGLTVRGFSETGILTKWCFGGYGRNIKAIDCNRAYDVDDGTGYGVSVRACFGMVWENITGHACRRTLDFIGTDGACYDCKTKNISGDGGGVAYDGESFWPEGPTRQSVTGSHGASFGTLYENPTGTNTHCVLNLRGDYEAVKETRGSGAMDRLVYLFRGGSIDLDGLHYTNRQTEIGVQENYRVGSTTDEYLQDVIRIDPAARISGRMTSIKNVNAVGVTRSFISVEGGGDLGPLSYGGVSIVVTDEPDDQQEFNLLRRSGTAATTLAAPTICTGEVSLINDSAYPKADMRDIDSDFSFGANVVHKLPGDRYAVYLLDDTAVIIDAYRRGTTILDLYTDNRGRDEHLFNGWLHYGRATNFTDNGSGDGVDIVGAALTGTTGTDGNISVSYRPADGEDALYIENRRGADELIIFHCPAVSI